MRNFRMTIILAACSLICGNPLVHLAAAESPDRPERFILVLGAEGTDEYAIQFADWAENWKQLAVGKQAELTVIGESLDARNSDRTLIEQELLRSPESYSATWLILIGHGTFDGKSARFNLRGPDLTAEQLKVCCDQITHPLAVLNCFSASGPFLQALSGENRVVISATKNGFEFYFSHFGKFLSAAASEPESDLDHDGQISLLEAYLAACRQTKAHYLEQGQLATEHALLDDNGDQRGSRADQFKGLDHLPEPGATASLPDGHRAQQFAVCALRPVSQITGTQKQLRDALEINILELKQRKTEFETEDDYYQQLEPLMIQLAEIYRQAERGNTPTIHDPLVVPVKAEQTGE
ncbi:hypothetical protein [Gimesia chilikensis]|uniref:hypothetical protein n=1 Tax=Gimesia chilikensis TaxID=2605989 RepID=UPI00118C8FAB|nr:hypothetical protein [Gimesia chilikensis]QDT84918.1 hypothetical protein MalM14_25820 [Gimesia chilikensis]